jgi:hypothetical protein
MIRRSVHTKEDCRDESGWRIASTFTAEFAVAVCAVADGAPLLIGWRKSAEEVGVALVFVLGSVVVAGVDPSATPFWHKLVHGQILPFVRSMPSAMAFGARLVKSESGNVAGDGLLDFGPDLKEESEK